MGSLVLWEDFINTLLLLLLQTEFRSIQSIFLLPTTGLHLPLLHLAPDGGRKPNSSQKPPPRFCFGPPQSAQFMTSPQVRPRCHAQLLKTNKFLNDAVRTYLATFCVCAQWVIGLFSMFWMCIEILLEFDGVGRANAPCRVLSLVGAGARPEGFEDELQKFSTRWHSHSHSQVFVLWSSALQLTLLPQH